MPQQPETADPAAEPETSEKSPTGTEPETLDDPAVETGAEPEVEGAEDEPISREAELEARVDELKDQLLRAVAEQENLRKRSEREISQLRKFGISNFARELLTAVDNLGRALATCPADDEITDESIRNLIVGLRMTERELQTVFARHGIRMIDPAGEKFDYNFHQAMFEIEDPDQEPGTVVQVLQPGYAIGDRVLRAAMVGVAKAVAETPPESGPDDTGSET